MAAGKWVFDAEAFSLDFETENGTCPFATIRDQYDTEAADTPEGEEWDRQQRALGERIADTLNQAHVFPEGEV